jgi:hypothetical protein
MFRIFHFNSVQFSLALVYLRACLITQGLDDDDDDNDNNNNIKRTCMLIDVAVPGDRNVIKKEAEKILTLCNPIFLPTAYSPALICFGRERGW